MNLTQGRYIAQVVGTENDPGKTGAVQVNVLGLTDSLDPAFMPWVRPSPAIQFHAVPEIGYYVSVYFNEGDIKQGWYDGVSQTGYMLDPEFVEGYPNVAVRNEGEDGFVTVHSRATKDTQTRHPSQMTRTWDNWGTVTYDTPRAYDNMGMGADEQAGTRLHPVLTEATINPFTCRPVGNGLDVGGTNQGSEYFVVPHMSKVSAGETGITLEPPILMDPLINLEPSVVRTLTSSSGAISYIEYVGIGHYTERSDKVTTKIILGNSGDLSFAGTLNKMRCGDIPGAHYIVGRGGNAEVSEAGIAMMATGSLDIESAEGFVQLIETTNDGLLGGDNARDAISIMLVGQDNINPVLDIDFTTKQYERVQLIIDTAIGAGAVSPQLILKKTKFEDASLKYADKAKDIGIERFDTSKLRNVTLP
jgi:hypothetical protein